MSVEKEPLWNAPAGEPQQDPIYYDKTDTPTIVCDLSIFLY